MFSRILTVCVGNICRSPMAEALLRARLSALPKPVLVESAGIGALVGRPADPIAVELMRERGLDLTGHRARQLTVELATGFDLLLVMEAGHQREIERTIPAVRGRVHLLGRFGKFDVPDPFRCPRADFERALALIERGVDDYAKAFFKVAAPPA